MKYFSVLCIFLICALAACYAASAEPNQADASLDEKKTEKRGIYGAFGYGHGGYGGYGGYYDHGVGIGYPHYGGYASAVHHGGYAAVAPYYGGHGFYPHYHHGLYH